MRPLLDDLELPNVQEITTHDLRMLAEHKPPGMQGSQLQNLGREPTSVMLCGVATGPMALNFVEQLDAKFRAQRPISFIADILADSNIEQMQIDDLKIEDLAGKPQRYSYHLALREYIEALAPAEIQGVAGNASTQPTESDAVNSEIESDAEENHESAVDGVDTRTGVLEIGVRLGDSQPLSEDLEILVEGETDEGEEVSFVISEHENGVFRNSNVQAGSYTVSLSSRQNRSST